MSRVTLAEHNHAFSKLLAATFKFKLMCHQCATFSFFKLDVSKCQIDGSHFCANIPFLSLLRTQHRDRQRYVLRFAKYLGGAQLVNGGGPKLGLYFNFCRSVALQVCHCSLLLHCLVIVLIGMGHHKMGQPLDSSSLPNHPQTPP